MDFAKAKETLARLKAENFRQEQLRKAVFDQAVSSYDEIKALPAALRVALEKEAPLLSFELDVMHISADGRARKAVLKLRDGRRIETVLLKPSPTRRTACISSQVGCAIACTFCATGLMGFTRDLTAEEISDQVLFWRQHIEREGLDGNFSNVVYMGMGEPFANYSNVADSLRVLMDQRLFGMGARHIAVSTSGLAPQMERFARDFPQVKLALSLHAANDALRTKLVPLNKAFPLARLADAMRRILQNSSRKIFLEYVLLRGENDTPRDAAELIAFVRSVGRPDLLHVNLIVYNETDTPHRSTAEEDARSFQARLREAGGLAVTLRQNLGRDIQGACGQLIAPSQGAAHAGQ